MKKKIVGIFICILFLFSTLPAVASISLEKIDKKRVKTYRPRVNFTAQSPIVSGLKASKLLTNSSP